MTDSEWKAFRSGLQPGPHVDFRITEIDPREIDKAVERDRAAGTGELDAE